MSKTKSLLEELIERRCTACEIREMLDGQRAALVRKVARADEEIEELNRAIVGLSSAPSPQGERGEAQPAPGSAADVPESMKNPQTTAGDPWKNHGTSQCTINPEAYQTYSAADSPEASGKTEGEGEDAGERTEPKNPPLPQRGG